MAPLISMLKMTISLERLTPEWLGISNGEVDRFGVDGSVEHIIKSKKTSKSWNLAKPGKKLSKSGNLTNFDIMEARPKFLTSNTKTAFYCLWLAFIKVLILQHFNLECHIWIETDASGYTISGMLN